MCVLKRLCSLRAARSAGEEGGRRGGGKGVRVGGASLPHTALPAAANALLIAVVDAQLLKGVGLEDLKAKDVEHADKGVRGRGGLLGGEARVALRDEPGEAALVDHLGERVARAAGLLGRQADVVDGVPALHLDEAPHQLDVQAGRAQQRGGRLLRLGAANGGGAARHDARLAFVILLKLHVAQVQHRRHDCPHRGLRGGADADGGQRGADVAKVGGVVHARDEGVRNARRVDDARQHGRGEVVPVEHRAARRPQPQRAALRRARAAHNVVEDVVVALALAGRDDARLL